MRAHERTTPPARAGLRRLLSAAPVAAAAWLALLAGPRAGAQEPERPVEPQRSIEPIGPIDGPQLGGPEVDAAQREMVELFGRVERRLSQIDRLLTDAGAGDTAKLRDVAASGIDELLARSRDEGRRAIEDIDRILDLAHQMNQQCQSTGGSSTCDKPGAAGQGNSPLDKVGSQETQREQTPEAPPETAKQSGGEKPGQKAARPEDRRNDPKGGQPTSPLAAQDSDPRNDPGGNPPGSGQEIAGRDPDNLDKWGDLPVHARDVFRTEGGGDMPARYRDWIDSYYRRLNERR
jgi:hypothetical protein